MSLFRLLCIGLLASDLGMAPGICSAQRGGEPDAAILSTRQWRDIDEATTRGLRYLASQQQADGSFATVPVGQPGVTALATLAFLSHGHLPGRGPYGERLDRAIDFILKCQHSNGLLALHAHNGPVVPTPLNHEVGTSAAYNHAIAGLALSETYGMTGGDEERLKRAIEKALATTLAIQAWPKQRAVDKGGWRYLHPFNESQADLSVVGWNLKFLRSAKNAGFASPEGAIEDAVAYVLRCFDRQTKSFEYDISSADRRTRAMAGVGILALAHSSKHNRPEAVLAADWILTRGFGEYNRTPRIGNNGYQSDRYHYGVFYCCLAMYQMGGRHWEEFFPPTADTLVRNQNGDGSWDAEGAHDGMYGRAYTTALVLLGLGAPNQLLPVYQR